MITDYSEPEKAKKKAANKVKYECGCGCVWGKPGLFLHCNDCELDFVATDPGPAADNLVANLSGAFYCTEFEITPTIKRDLATPNKRKQMDLFTEVQTEELLRNGGPDWTRDDHVPVAKLYIPGTKCVWLVTELKPDDPTKALALFVDDGMTMYSRIDLQKLSDEVPEYYHGRTLCLDPDFVATNPISDFRFAATTLGYIIDDPDDLPLYMRHQKTFQYKQ